MTIGIIKSTDDPLVPIIPKGITQLNDLGFQVSFQKGAGSHALYFDEAYEKAGASVVETNDVLKDADLLVTTSHFPVDVLERVNPGTTIIGMFDQEQEEELLEAGGERALKIFNLALLPRISIAQSMDILSSQSSLSGYKAVIVAADHLQGYMPMMTTAAGTIPPARVLILGAGVAGLQAIATARRLGAMVEAFDVRSAVKEEVESLGAKFIEVEGSSEDKAAGGYAITQTKDYEERQKQLIHEKAVQSDVVITTAVIPRKPAPLLLEEKTVDAMKPGSVIIDMATASGGNCECSRDGMTIKHGHVTIIGNSRLYRELPLEASRKFNNNLISFMKFVFKNGIENLPYDHEIVSKTLISGEFPAKKTASV